MYKWIFIASCLVSFLFPVYAVEADITKLEKPIWITVDADFRSTAKSLSSGMEHFTTENGISLYKITDQSVFEKISEKMHEKFNRCGGFLTHENFSEARNELKTVSSTQSSRFEFFNSYAVKSLSIVKNLLADVNEVNIFKVMKHLSDYKNRYYKSPQGIESSNWIHDHWTKISAARSDMTVEKFTHPGWPQPSIILTIEGRSASDEIVVIGGHADSISKSPFSKLFPSKMTAPGADDNASGIAAITEVIRVVVESGIQPERTIKFMAYAAEEVGLKGSKEIANKFKAEGKKVVGVMQLDMVNFKGTSTVDITLINDFTNEKQNAFLGEIIDEYLQVKWGYGKCGYGCSDHASWHRAGFPASMPAEATPKTMNPKIHTKGDTMGFMGNTAKHSVVFSKLGLAYILELAL